MWLRVAVDYGALLAFSVAFALTRDLVNVATPVLMAASVVAVILGYLIERRVAPLPALYGGFAIVFGSLTLIFQDKSFVKMKLTFVDTALAVALLAGLLLKRNPLKIIMNDAIRLPDAAWRTLMMRYAVFFLACAASNELVWRTQSDGRWLIFRGVLLVAALAFSVAQTPFFMKHMLSDDAATAAEPPDPGS